MKEHARTRQVRTVAASEFKAKCLALFEEVGAGGGELVVITSHGRPVATVEAANGARSGEWPFPNLSHLYDYIGDVVTPIDVEWKAMK